MNEECTTHLFEDARSSSTLRPKEGELYAALLGSALRRRSRAPRPPGPAPPPRAARLACLAAARARRSKTRCSDSGTTRTRLVAPLPDCALPPPPPSSSGPCRDEEEEDAAVPGLGDG